MHTTYIFFLVKLKQLLLFSNINLKNAAKVLCSLFCLEVLCLVLLHWFYVSTFSHGFIWTPNSGIFNLECLRVPYCYFIERHCLCDCISPDARYWLQISVGIPFYGSFKGLLIFYKHVLQLCDCLGRCDLGKTSDG